MNVMEMRVCSEAIDRQEKTHEVVAFESLYRYDYKIKLLRDRFVTVGDDITKKKCD